MRKKRVSDWDIFRNTWTNESNYKPKLKSKINQKNKFVFHCKECNEMIEKETYSDVSNFYNSYICDKCLSELNQEQE